jgi:hypothetical protein
MALADWLLPMMLLPTDDPHDRSFVELYHTPPPDAN